ncbi:MAG TPA: SCO family protein [Pyrinomonadaceae bacterium]|jgi:protein SCO1/2|nr:SCO family protein [Pyrinomonadaceae bacterium]
MHTNKSFALLLITLFVFVVSLSSCQPRQRVRSPTEKHYDFKGKVVVVDKAQHLLTISHEDIKDYMPGMTMPFSVKDDWVFEIAAPGNQITATLIVDGAQSWLEDVVITETGNAVNEIPAEGLQPKAGDEVPDYRLINQDGKTTSLHNYKGKVLLLTFIYTRCQDPNQCTLMSSNFAAIEQELRKQPELYQKTHLLSISFDPAYDTPKVLRSYGAAYTGKYSDEDFAHWEFASGSADEVKGVAQFFGLRYYLESSGQEQVIHSLRTAVIGPDGKVVKVYRGNEWKPEEILRDIQGAITNTKLAADSRE